MIQVVCNIETNSQLSLKKVKPNIYFDEERKQFYKLSFFPSATFFEGQTVVSRRISSFTKFDPNFLIINYLYKNKNIKTENVPNYLSHLDWMRFAKIEEKSTNQQYFNVDIQKIYNFLEIKAEKIMKCLRENKFLNRITLKSQKQGQKQINEEAVIILKLDVEQDLITSFAKERYAVIEQQKKHLNYYDSGSNHEGEHKKPNKSQPKKPEKPEKHFNDKSQSTLNMFAKKDKK